MAAHHGEGTRVMVRERVVRISMAAAVHACDPRVAPIEAGIRLTAVDPKGRARRDVPTSGPRDRRSRTRCGTRPIPARRARVEASGGTRRGHDRVDEQGRAECHPGTELRMDEQPERAPGAETRRLGEVHEGEPRGRILEREPQLRPGTRAPHERQRVLAKHVFGERVERMRTVAGIGTTGEVGTVRGPERAPAIADDHDRARPIVTASMARGHERVVRLRGRDAEQIQSERRERASERGEHAQRDALGLRDASRRSSRTSTAWRPKSAALPTVPSNPPTMAVKM